MGVNFCCFWKNYDPKALKKGLNQSNPHSIGKAAGSVNSAIMLGSAGHAKA